MLFFIFFFFPQCLLAVAQDAITMEVGVKTLVFHDEAREKILITEVFYPAEDGVESEKTTTDIFDRIKEARDAKLLQKEKKYPLIVVSHGQKGDRFSLSPLLNVLAAHGYIVAAVDHVGSTWSNHNPEEAIKRWKRTDDISSVINAILKDPLFGPHINSSKIGMIGYSLGALTGVWLAGGVAALYQKPSMSEKKTIELEEGLTEEMIEHLDIREATKSHKDPRIKAFVLLSPVYGSSFDKSGLSGVKAPVLIIAAEEDKVSPPNENARFFKEALPAATLLMIEDGHTIFLNKPERGTPSTIQKTVAKETLKFFDQTL